MCLLLCKELYQVKSCQVLRNQRNKFYSRLCLLRLQRQEMPELRDLPEGIKGRQSQQREQQIFHSLREILVISVPFEEEHQHVSVTKESQNYSAAIHRPS